MDDISDELRKLLYGSGGTLQKLRNGEFDVHRSEFTEVKSLLYEELKNIAIDNHISLKKLQSIWYILPFLHACKKRVSEVNPRNIFDQYLNYVGEIETIFGDCFGYPRVNASES